MLDLTGTRGGPRLQFNDKRKIGPHRITELTTKQAREATLQLGLKMGTNLTSVGLVFGS